MVGDTVGDGYTGGMGCLGFYYLAGGLGAVAGSLPVGGALVFALSAAFCTYLSLSCYFLSFFYSAFCFQSSFGFFSPYTFAGASGTTFYILGLVDYSMVKEL